MPLSTKPITRWLMAATFWEGLLLGLLHQFIYPLPREHLGEAILLWSLGGGLVFVGSYLFCASVWRGGATRRLARVPFQLFLLRPVLWLLVALSGGLYFLYEGVFSVEGLSRIPGISLSGAVLLGPPLGLLMRREVGRVLKQDELWHYAETLHELLFFISIIIASSAVLATRLMYHAILGITVVHLRRHLVVMPWVGIAAGVIWLWALWYWTRHPRRFLVRISNISAEEPAMVSLGLGGKHGLTSFMTPAPMVVPEMVPLAPEASKVYAALQRLPGRLAFYSFGLWFLSNSGTTLFQWYWFGTAPEDVLLMLVLGTILAFCLSFYILVWHRSTASFGLRYLSVRFPISSDTKKHTPLRARITLAFGGLLIFACLAALLSALSQFKRASTALVAEQGKARAADLARQLEDSSNIVKTLWHEVRSPGEAAIFIPQKGSMIIAGDLPERIRLRELVAVSESGILELNAEGLVGGFTSVKDKGQVAFLMPVQSVPGVERSLWILIAFFFLLTGVCLGVVFALARDLTSPLEELTQHTARIARGDYSRIPLGGTGELAALTYSFEKMRAALAETLIRIDDLNAGLEGKVKARTAELERKRHELEETLRQLTEAQAQLVQSEKMASLGFLVAGIAHDINNPVNAIRNNLEPLEEIIRALLEVVSLYQAAAQAFEEDQPDAEKLLAQAEAKVKAIQYEEAKEDIERILRILHNGTERTTKIVASLKNFSRVGEAKQKAVDLHHCLDETLELIGYHLRQRQIQVKRQYGNLGLISCDAGALNQVFMNLLSNAIDALTDWPNPTIQISTKRDGDWAIIEIEDNGPGIKEELLARIFEPFFTTKEGHGTGLGLSISRRIITGHNGTLEVRSAPRSTCFTIRLPAR